MGTQTLLTGSHVWQLNDTCLDATNSPVDCQGQVQQAKDSVGTLHATGNSGTSWNTGDLFSPDVKFDASHAGTLTTSGPAIATDQDFSASAWALPTVGWTLFSQNGQNGTAFKVYADAGSNSWRFAMSRSDTANASAVFDVAAAPAGSVQLGVWSQITVSYRRSTGLMSLYVNGELAATAFHTTVWNPTTGAFKIGAARESATVHSGYYTGQIALVQTWSQVIDPGKGATTGDVLAHYANPDGSSSVLRLPHTGNRSTGAPIELWRSAAYPAASTKSVSGDFNGDGITDVALLRDAGGSDWRSTLLIGRPGGALDQQAETSHGFISAWGLQLVAGDANGDGRDDLITYHNDSSWNFRLIVLPARADGTGFGPISIWYTLSDGSWNYGQAKLVAGDFNGDGEDDVAAFYYYGTAQTTLFMFTSNGSSFSRSVAWTSGVGNWDSDRAKYASGDINNDGLDDVVASYDYGSDTLRMWGFIFHSGSSTTTTTGMWASGTGGWSAARTKFVLNDVTGDNRADVVAFYRYDNNSAVLGLDSDGLGNLSPWYNRVNLATSYDWNRITPL
jgi:hypothetical protein